MNDIKPAEIEQVDFLDHLIANWLYSIPSPDFNLTPEQRTEVLSKLRESLKGARNRAPFNWTWLKRMTKKLLRMTDAQLMDWAEYFERSLIIHRLQTLEDLSKSQPNTIDLPWRQQ